MTTYAIPWADLRPEYLQRPRYYNAEHLAPTYVWGGIDYTGRCGVARWPTWGLYGLLLYEFVLRHA